MDNDQFVGRMDHNITEKDTIFGRSSSSASTNVLPATLPPPSSVPSIVTPEAHSFAASETHVFTSAVLNEARIGYQETRETQNINGQRLFDEYGIVGAPDVSTVLGSPIFAVSGAIAVGRLQDCGTACHSRNSDAALYAARGRVHPAICGIAVLPVYAHTFPHIPLGASERFRGKSKQGLYGDVVEEIDWSVGEVLRELKERGLEKNTLVMFSSDNGPWYQGSPGVLRGRKATTYEGGVREPFIARWPGKIPAGRTCHAVASLMDVFPTIVKLCGGKLPAKPLDGVDLWPLLTGTEEEIEREPLLYFDNWDLQCARWKQWKLHVARHNTDPYDGSPAEGGRHSYVLPKPELYDLVKESTGEL